MHTLRYLRPVQFYGRLWFRYAPHRPDIRPAPSLREIQNSAWVPPALRAPSLTGPRLFEVLNDVYDVNISGWDDPARDKLLRYNVHYFDDLVAFDAPARAAWHAALLADWVAQNPPAAGTGWEPYPASRRVVNWIKWALSGNALPATCVDSLAVQTRWISKRLEIHLLGNHLFANAKALVFAGLYFRGAEADAWMNTGMEILAQQVPEQILADGGHFERSTMYHALALEDMLDLVNVTQSYPRAVFPHWQPLVADWRRRIGPMSDWLQEMSHPDGGIGFFNDSALGIAPDNGELRRYAAMLGFETERTEPHALTYLGASGYARVEAGDAVALIDVAPVGPDYLPGHAHADTLSFELSLFGRRVFVNSGTSLYGTGAERQRQRSTAAHNTVTIDGEDSSEVWAGFRVARRARPIDVGVGDTDGVTIRASHDGYDRLRGKPKHSRDWKFRGSALTIEDRVTGPFGRAESALHLHPSVRVEQSPAGRASESSVVLVLPGGERATVTVEGGVLRTEASSWHPEFGQSIPSLRLVTTFAGPLLRTRITWTSAG